MNANLLIFCICTLLIGIHVTGYEIHGLQSGFFSRMDTISSESFREGLDKPNIILIMADDLGHETLKSYGGESYHTPNLDKLAATGMQFQYCYATPLCTTSRVQLMTGKYNFRNYIGFGLLDPNESTIGHAMQEAGYQTCIAGKWQLYGNEHQQKLAGGHVGALPQDAGFDTYRLWQVKDRGLRYKNPTFETFQAGLETVENGYGPDGFTEFVEEFMTQYRNQPFFVYYPMCLVHDPFVPTPNTLGFETFDPGLKVNDTTYFDDMMTYMDQQIGRIVKKVDDLGIRNNTVILFIGDNGTDRKVISSWKGQRIQGRKGYTVEAGTHVPFIANWKGTIVPGLKNENLVDFTDFLPSLLDIAGTKDLWKETMDGVSFYPQLIGEPSKSRDWIFCHYDPRWGKFPKKRYVQNTEWKLYEEGAFYHVASDPQELNSLKENELTSDQIRIKEHFQEVLNLMKK
jgi:arylsulfatase A-like enzyme